MTTTFKTYVQSLAPRGGWLTDAASQAWLGGMGEAIETTTQLVRSGVKARFTPHAPADALPLLGDNRQIEQAPEETDDDYRDRLAEPFDYHTFRHAETGYQNALIALGFAREDVVVLGDHTDSVLPSPDPASAWWSRITIVVDSTSGPWSAPVWDAGDVWSDEAVWGIDGVTQAEIKYLRRTIRRNKWAGAFPLALVIVYDSGAWPLSTDWGAQAWVGDPDVAVMPLGRVWGWNETVYGSAPDLWMADEVWADAFTFT